MHLLIVPLALPARNFQKLRSSAPGEFLPFMKETMSALSSLRVLTNNRAANV